MDEQEKPQSLFERLKQIRIQQNLNLNTISKKSRIHIKYLKAIESGEIKQIPEVYDKLFFQTYVSFLKLEDTEQVFAEFRSIRKQIRPGYSTTINNIKTIASDPDKSSRLKKMYIILPIIVLVLIISIMAINSITVKDNDSEPVKELAVREIANKIELKNKAKKDSIIQQSQLNKKNVFINIKAVDRTWLRFIKDHADTNEYLLTSGNRLDIQADSLVEFLVGNANGLKFKINSNNVGVLGKPGEVITYLKITPKGIIDKKIKKVARRAK
jgi:transcriptional regulator with XRE-family HTH domain